MINDDIFAKAEMWDLFLTVARKMLHAKSSKLYYDYEIRVTMNALSNIDGSITDVKYTSTSPSNGETIESDNLEEVYIKILLNKLDFLEKQNAK